MTTGRAFFERHPVPSYFALTFAISWGGFLLTVGPGGFANSNRQTDARFPFVVLAMLAGPTVAAILLTGVLDGRTGLREILSRLLRWRVGVRWYAVALLPAPLLAGAVLFALSLTSPIFTADNKAAVVLSGLAAGASTLLEEVGWTGFAVPRLRRRYNVVTTGIIVGVLWGAWHFLQGLYISDTYAGTIPVTLFLVLNSFGAIAQLTAYRVLLVWVYDQTGSLLLVTLMHASLTASTIFIFRPLAVGMSFLMYGWLFTAALWVFVALVALTRHRQFSGQPLLPRAA
jgi:membrane protease YdiL (CAAX protease family)